MTAANALGDDPAEQALSRAMFGAELVRAQRYAAMLREDGVAHGHLGPREGERVWARHVLNSAVVTDLVPVGEHVIDVGSGAGLPGLPMAIRRPDLRLTLVEPMQRRVDFLVRCVDRLGLATRVTVLRARAGDADAAGVVGTSQWVTARAVAPLDRLVRWCLPLLSEGGALLALKGDRAQSEVAEHAPYLRRAGVAIRSVEELPVGEAVTRVVVLERRAKAKDGRMSGGGRDESADR